MLLLFPATETSTLSMANSIEVLEANDSICVCHPPSSWAVTSFKWRNKWSSLHKAAFYFNNAGDVVSWGVRPGNLTRVQCTNKQHIIVSIHSSQHYLLGHCSFDRNRSISLATPMAPPYHCAGHVMLTPTETECKTYACQGLSVCWSKNFPGILFFSRVYLRGLHNAHPSHSYRAGNKSYYSVLSADADVREVASVDYGRLCEWKLCECEIQMMMPMLLFIVQHASLPAYSYSWKRILMWRTI